MPTARSDLMCEVIGLSYDFDKGSGRLKMAPFGSCDMSGLIALFTKIDPNVQWIETFAGDSPDGMYRRGPDGWDSVVTR
jgi:hypothetical protein